MARQQHILPGWTSKRADNDKGEVPGADVWAKARTYIRGKARAKRNTEILGEAQNDDRGGFYF
jgi:hypothetical protein